MGNGDEGSVETRAEDRRARAEARRAGKSKRAKRKARPDDPAPDRHRKNGREGEGVPAFVGRGATRDEVAIDDGQASDAQPGPNPYAPPKEKAQRKRRRGKRKRHTRATPMHRFVNLVVDTLAIGGINFCVFMAIARLGRPSASDAIYWAEMGAYLSWGTWFVYYLVCETLWGRTLGKMFTGTIVVADDGNRRSLGRIAIRTLCRFVPFEALSFLGASAHGWHDRWSRTQVVLYEK